MGITIFLKILRYAITGKQRYRKRDWMQLATDVKIPSPLFPRDKHSYKTADYFHYSVLDALGCTRYCWRQDREKGVDAVKRIYLRLIADGYIGYIKLSYTAGLDFDEMKKVIPEMLEGLVYGDPIYRQQYPADENNHILDALQHYHTVSRTNVFNRFAA
jgi:hypothetical protein